MTSSVAKPITPEDFLSKPDIETLIAVRRDSRRMFDVGDIADRAIQKAARMDVPKFKVLSTIGELCGLGGRRVEKLRRVAEIFCKTDREAFLAIDMPFTYFETAFDFHNETGEALMFLQFTQHWLEDKGKWPGVDYAASIFRTHGLGLDVSPIEIGEQNPAPARLTRNPGVPEPSAPPEPYFSGITDYMGIEANKGHETFVEKSALQGLLDMWRSCANMTVESCIHDLEALIGADVPVAQKGG